VAKTDPVLAKALSVVAPNCRYPVELTDAEFAALAALRPIVIATKELR
jgi:hypothetical protein